MDFQAQRSLLNPLFNNYKVDPNHEISTAYIPWGTPDVLAGRSLIPEAIGQTYTWAETRARARWNHLGISDDDSSVAWIDQNAQVWVAAESMNMTPKFLCRLAVSDNVTQNAEYPTIVAAEGSTESAWIASDGCGGLYKISPVGSILSKSIYCVLNKSSRTNDNYAVPFKLHGVYGTTALVSINLNLPHSSEYHYRISLVKFADEGFDNCLEILWSVLSCDVPTYVWYDSNNGAWRVGSASAFVTDAASVQEESSALAAENATADTTPGATRQADDVKLPKYSWTQTNDSVTVSIPLPPSLSSTDDIQIELKRDKLSFNVDEKFRDSASSQPVDVIPQFVDEKLWAPVTLDGSTWTFEKIPSISSSTERSPSIPLVTIYLDKADTGIRWPFLFSEASPQISVPEALDQNTLEAINASMEKYVVDTPATAEEGGDANAKDKGGIGVRDDLTRDPHFGNPSSLVGDEIDMEIDTASANDQVFFANLPLTGLQKKSEKTETQGQSQISTTLPSKSLSDGSIVVKKDVDGLLFVPSKGPPWWTHKSTFPAMSFVLASKRSLRSVHHISHHLVIALEASGSTASQANTSIKTSSGNAYIYYAPPPGTRATTSKSVVLPIVNADSGDILGIQQIRTGGQSIKVIILCERCTVIVSGL